jgi:hypothetical protein
LDQDRTGFGTGAGDGGRQDRPLGRGLGDISHLFRSGGSSEAAGNGPLRNIALQRTTPPRGSRTDAVLLGARAPLTRDQLAALLTDFTGALDDGLTSIDSALPCPPCGEIDLLALSRAQQLTIIDFDTTGGEGLLLRGLGHHDWATRNLPIIRRLYPGRAIDFSLPPALMLVAPQFSPLLRSAARQVTRPVIKWVRYYALESAAGLGVFFERLESD